jgi:hypothetical protein
MKIKPPSKNQVARQLMAEFQVCRRTVFNWFADGCPADFDAAMQWRQQRIADEAVRRPCGPEPLALVAIDEASNLSAAEAETMSYQSLSDRHARLVQLVVEMRLAGVSVHRIAKAVGCGPLVVNRICDSHPDTKEKDAALAKAGWSEIRRMSCDLLRERLADPETADRIRPQELALISGIASDKLYRDSNVAEITLSINQKINALSFEELINSIPKEIEGEFEFVQPVQPAGYEIEKEGQKFSPPRPI